MPDLSEQSNYQPPVWSVTDATAYIKNLLVSDSKLRLIQIKGEVSDFKRAYSGHCYFKLKDRNAVLTCVMFRSRATRVKFDVGDGLKVIAVGSITVYEKGGNYQLIVEQLKQEGLGELFLKFLQLKEKLEKKGWFSPHLKNPLPFLPKGIGVATSARGAALHDIITTITNRFPPAGIFIVPTAVQGNEAPASIIRSIKILEKHPKVEVLIVGRGGGSFEDLNCFNDEKVAEAIHKCTKPIISGVGHETDFTICDMVADWRAATPTAAAQAVVPQFDDLMYDLSTKKNRLIQHLRTTVKDKKARLKALRPDNLHYFLENMISGKKQDVDLIMSDISRLLNNKMEKYLHRLEKSGENLNALNPFRVMERGYAIVKDRETGKIISKAADTSSGQVLNVGFSDGEIVVGVK